MSPKLVNCSHCGGKKQCSHSGGRSCRECLEAAGLGRRGWATVRCSYCGGRGKIWAADDAAEGEAPAEAAETAEAAGTADTAEAAEPAPESAEPAEAEKQE
jgi:hypothetical protein